MIRRGTNVALGVAHHHWQGHHLFLLRRANCASSFVLQELYMAADNIRN